MDISIVPISSPKWQTITYVPDEYFYAQDHQQNYSAIVVSTRMINKIITYIIIYNIHGKGEKEGIYEKYIMYPVKLKIILNLKFAICIHL